MFCIEDWLLQRFFPYQLLISLQLTSELFVKKLTCYIWYYMLYMILIITTINMFDTKELNHDQICWLKDVLHMVWLYTTVKSYF